MEPTDHVRFKSGILRTIVSAAVAALIAACQVLPTAEERATPTPTPVPGTPTPTATPTRIPTPTVTPKPTSTPTAKEIAHQGIAPLMEQRAEAILASDKAAFMATVSDKDPEFYAAQETLFEYLQPLPFASLEFIVDRDSGHLDDRRQDWKLDGVEVEWRYTWRGVEDQIRGDVFDFEFAQENGVWKVTGDALSDEDSWWMLAPLHFKYTDHFLIFYHSNFSDRWRDVADMLEGTYDSLGQKIAFATGTEPADIYVVLVASDAEEFRTLGGGGAHTQGFVSVQTRVNPQGLQIAQLTVYLNGGSLREGRAGDFLRTIEHELAHAILYPITFPFTPPWLSEGAAMYLSNAQIGWEFLEQEGLQVLENYQYTVESMTDDECLGCGIFGRFAAHAWARYNYSNAVTRYLIETFGEESYWEFYLSYSQVPWEEIEPHTQFFGPGWGNLAIRVTDRSMREIFGLSEAELDQRVKAWIDERLAS